MNGFSSKDPFGKSGRLEMDKPKGSGYLLSAITSEPPHHHRVNSGEQTSISFEQTSGNKVKDNGQEGSTGYQATTTEPIMPSRNDKEGKIVALCTKSLTSQI